MQRADKESQFCVFFNPFLLFMKKILLSAILAGSAFNAAQAQTVSSFESLTLPASDTAYVNYSQPGKDVGFDDGLAHFPCVYDTSFGFSYWDYGFAYSNKKDSVTAGYLNQYSARAGKAAVGTKYAVAYRQSNGVRLLGAARGNNLSGLWITNSTYTYYSLLNGDGFARKFGDTTGTGSGTAYPQGGYPDYFKLTVYGYLNGTKKADSVDFYLADYRSSNSANDYIVKDWKWVSLTGLGKVDSVNFRLNSSDAGNNGMNTPAYFCLDEFTTNETNVSTGSLVKSDLKIYPNPATTTLWVEDGSRSLKTVSLLTAGGQLLRSQAANGAQTEVDVQGLPAGMYYLILEGTEGRAMHTFLKN